MGGKKELKMNQRSPHHRLDRIKCITAIILGLFVCGIMIFLLSVSGDRDDAINPLKSTYLYIIVLLRQDDLNTPVDSTAGSLQYRLEPGISASDIAQELVSLGVIRDSSLFINYLVYSGNDRNLEAGVYEVSAAQTIPQIAEMLISGETARITLSVIEGWRREQIAEAIDLEPLLPFTGTDFLSATDPGATLPESFVLSGDLKQGASVEGFLYPDTYVIPIDSTASQLVEMMLQNYMLNVTDDIRAAATSQGMSMYEVVTLASIVEREVIHDDEGNDVAAVYLNRLRIGMRLEADPTVQYALGFSESENTWWPVNLTISDFRENDSPFNTYVYPGLPPSPIANPGIEAIRAVVFPAESGFYFFRAACDGSGFHSFAETYDEHLANGCP